jgi:hypothetical protein
MATVSRSLRTRADRLAQELAALKAVVWERDPVLSRTARKFDLEDEWLDPATPPGRRLVVERELETLSEPPQHTRWRDLFEMEGEGPVPEFPPEPDVWASATEQLDWCTEVIRLLWRWEYGRDPKPLTRAELIEGCEQTCPERMGDLLEVLGPEKPRRLVAVPGTAEKPAADGEALVEVELGAAAGVPGGLAPGAGGAVRPGQAEADGGGLCRGPSAP